MVSDQQDKVFEILRLRGQFSVATEKVARGFMARWGVDAYRAVIETHLVEESKMADILAEEMKLPRLLRIRILTVETNVFESIPYELALEYVVFPFEIRSDGTVKVAIADPTSPERIELLQKAAGNPLEVFVGERSEIISAIQRHYPLSKQLPSLVSMMRARKDEP